MTRYVTRWYVTTDAEDAQRLAAIDHTPEDEIDIVHDVELLHKGASWSYWSDGQLINRTMSRSCAEMKATLLTPDAVRLIECVMGSDSGDVDGGGRNAWSKWTRYYSVNKL